MLLKTTIFILGPLVVKLSYPGLTAFCLRNYSEEFSSFVEHSFISNHSNSPDSLLC